MKIENPNELEALRQLDKRLNKKAKSLLTEVKDRDSLARMLLYLEDAILKRMYILQGDEGDDISSEEKDMYNYLARQIEVAKMAIVNFKTGE